MEDKKPSSDWPPEGNVEFSNYSVRYREGLDLVLRNISLQVKGGEKVSNDFRTSRYKVLLLRLPSLHCAVHSDNLPTLKKTNIYPNFFF